MALTDTDHRRIFLATAVTLVALPALWWANSANDSAAPAVAVAGVEVAAGSDAASTNPDDDVELGAAEPVFLDGPSSETGAGQQVIAVPGKPAIDGILAQATFRSTLPNASTCIVPGLASGSQVIVMNLDNSRSIACTTMSTPDGVDEVVLHTSAFAELADLTDAPIAVEIRQ